MRILHISTRLILGGSQENTVLSCEGQARRGNEVHLAFGPIYGPEGSLLDRVANFRTPDGHAITTHVVPDLIRAIHPWRDLKARRQLERLIREIRPDIVHTHSSKAGILGRAAGWSQRSLVSPPIGVVHTIHGPPFHDHQNALVRRAYIASERWAARRCHRIVSVADAMTRQYLAVGIGRPAQYTAVYSGMETEPFLDATPGQSRESVRDSLGLSDADFVIGTVSRLAELKGHDDVLDSLAADLKSHPTWRLLWVGDGWWRKRLTEKAQGMGLRVASLDNPRQADQANAQVLLTGLVSPDRIPGLLRAMDLLIHPSYREGLPRTVPQALLCGTPVAASDTDGTAEACIDGVTGRLFKPGDLAGLRRAVEWTAANRDQARVLASAGREQCRERFSVERMVEDLEQVYRKARAGASD